MDAVAKESLNPDSSRRRRAGKLDRARWNSASDPGNRVCVLCSNEQPLEQFRDFGTHRSLTCRSCRLKKAKAYRDGLSEAGRERALDVMTAWGISIKPEEIECQRSKQGGLCAICMATMIRGRGNTGQNVDHDHNTFRPRGLLCKECNRKLGRFEEVLSFAPEFRDKLVAYLGHPPWDYVGQPDVELIRRRMRHRERRRISRQSSALPS